MYVKTDKATLAFKLDEAGDILFASCTGDAATKATLSQGIAKTLIGSSADDVEALFDKVEESRWLNAINSLIVSD